jgi:hypothetical protein
LHQILTVTLAFLFMFLMRSWAKGEYEKVVSPDCGGKCFNCTASHQPRKQSLAESIAQSVVVIPIE